MEFKHTPAPWYVEDNGTYFDIRECNNYRLIADICGSQISYDKCIHSNNGIANANAHLIAAAPELLEALIQAADYMWEDTRDVNFDGTMIFGIGYDWDGWDSLREEIHTQKGSFAIWPSGLDRAWYAYGGEDGTYWSVGFKTKQEARSAVIKHLINLVPNHPAVLSHLAIAKALGQQ